MMMTGSQMVTEAIAKENVNVVYGFPGGAIMNVYDDFY
jgi:acetolactate synthase-1/2/3 large subunit